jgi:tetratricopeptide (TPR) repeat protein
LGKTEGVIMRVPRNILNFFCDNWDQDPEPTMRELFQKDGWGPGPSAQNLQPYKYRGPQYPLPMHPKTFASQKESTQLCNQARCAWSKKSLEEATRLYCMAAEKEPANPDFIFEMAQMLWGQNQLAEAKHLLEEARRIKPDWYPAIVSLVRLNVLQGELQEALENDTELMRCMRSVPLRVLLAASRRIRCDLLGRQ